MRRGSDAPRQSRAAECPTRRNVGLHVFPCVVTVLGGFGGQGTGHGIPTDGPKRLNKGYDLFPDSSTPDFGLRVTVISDLERHPIGAWIGGWGVGA